MEYNYLKPSRNILSSKQIDARKMFLLTIAFMLFSISFFGQTIVHESEIKNSSNPFTENGSDSQNLKSLLYETNSAAYFQDGQNNFYGQSPLVLYIDFEQFASIASQMSRLQNVELVKIYFKANRPSKIDTQILNRLPNLKYVFLVCDTCNVQDIKNMITSVNEAPTKEIMFIYNSDKKN